MSEKVIYNCHTHIFTHENLPNRFLPLYIVPALRFTPLRWIASLLMKALIPFKRYDRFNRLAAYVNSAYLSEEKLLERLMSYYPKESRFVILPMDFEYMKAGNVKKGIERQHAKLAELTERINKNDREIIIPFAHIDPRHDNALEMLIDLVEQNGFKGVKIYPTLGYTPDDQVLVNEIYPYMSNGNLPLIAHCSCGHVNIRGMDQERAHAFAHPRQYIDIMKKFPDLRVCLAHFGGSCQWKYYRDTPGDQDPLSWLRYICELIRSGDCPNLYVDVSHTIMNFHENHALLSVLMEEPRIAKKVLFGSDYYAGEKMKYPEKMLSIDLRHTLGEDKFWQIANENPRVFLSLP